MWSRMTALNSRPSLVRGTPHQYLRGVQLPVIFSIIYTTVCQHDLYST